MTGAFNNCDATFEALFYFFLFFAAVEVIGLVQPFKFDENTGPLIPIMA